MLGHPQPRQLAPSQSHPNSAFEPPNHPFRESSFQHVPTTNGHPPMHYQPHPSSFQPGPFNQAMQLPRPPHPPRAAFDNFVENWIMARPNEYPHNDNNEELVRISREAWETPSLTGHRNHFVEKYNSKVQQYERDLEMYQRELEHFERERERTHYEAQERREGREMEIERALPPPPPQREGGGGGFTSING